MWDFWWKKRQWDRFSFEDVGFSLSISFYQCNTQIFIYKLLLPEGQRSGKWKRSKKEVLAEIVEHSIDNRFHFFRQCFKMLNNYLSLSVLYWDTSEILTEDSRALPQHQSAVIASCLEITNKRATSTFFLELTSFTYLFFLKVFFNFRCSILSTRKPRHLSLHPKLFVPRHTVPSCLFKSVFMATTSWKPELQCLEKPVLASILHATPRRRRSGSM